MRYWLNLGFIDVDHLAPLARVAEECGFEGVTLPDHLVYPKDLSSAYPYSPEGEVAWSPSTPWPDAWVAIAAMAAVTERLQFGTSVYVAPLRDPFNLAKAISTASALSGGRVMCAFGTGWLKEEFDMVGTDFDSRGARVDEMLAVMRLLWSGEMVEFHGRFYDFAPVQMSPAARPISVLIGGNSQPARRRAARHDGWLGVYEGVDKPPRSSRGYGRHAPRPGGRPSPTGFSSRVVPAWPPTPPSSTRWESKPRWCPSLRWGRRSTDPA